MVMSACLSIECSVVSADSKVFYNEGRNTLSICICNDKRCESAERDIIPASKELPISKGIHQVALGSQFPRYP